MDKAWRFMASTGTHQVLAEADLCVRHDYGFDVWLDNTMYYNQWMKPLQPMRLLLALSLFRVLVSRWISVKPKFARFSCLYRVPKDLPHFD